MVTPSKKHHRVSVALAGANCVSVTQVIPYDAYKDAAAVLCRDCAPAAAVKHAQQSSNELDRVRKLLLHVRGTIYHKLNVGAGAQQ